MGILTHEETVQQYPIGTVVVLVAYDDDVRGVDYTPGTVLTVVGHTADCGSDGLRVRRADGVGDLVFATEVRIVEVPS